MPPRSLQPQLHHNVRILLVGDPGVGKTSIILSLISEEFIEGDEGQIPNRSEEIIIPPDVTPELVPTIIVDYSSKEQAHEDLVDEILRAHVICIIYGVDNDGSMESIGNYWLPLIRKTLGGGDQLMEAAGGGQNLVAQHQQGFKTKIPILLVGNRIDLVDYTTMDIVVPLMNEWPEIETCIECSAKTLRNISELFFYAQKAVLHPTAPLYNSEKKELTEPARQALQRIFRICDVNNDGILDDLEMYSFQKFCYDSPLQPDALDSVKHIIQRNAIDGVFNNGITLNGFLTLHTLFIQRGKHETTWTALRKFGYNDQITICNDYLCPILSIPITSTAELNPIGFDFFTKIFIKYDRDRDSCLSPEELLNLFSTSPGIPWAPSSFAGVCRNARGYLTYNGFMCQWVLTTLLDVNKTMEYMAYLGYPITSETDQSEGITVTREKRLDLAKKASTRTVYRCHVIGARGVGKSTICRQFVQRSRTGQEHQNPNDNSESPRYVINSVKVYGEEKYLVMQDIDLARVLDILPTAEIMCDVACLVYDTSDPKSFEFIARTYLNYYSSLKIPVLIIGNKADLGSEVLQDYILQPGHFCTKYNLPQPHLYSSLATGDSSDEIYVKLATMAAYPRFRAAWRIFYRTSHRDNATLFEGSNTGSLFKAGIGIALLGTVGYFVYKSIFNRRLMGNQGGK